MSIIVVTLPKERKLNENSDASDLEIAKSMTYPTVSEGGNNTDNEYVKFDAFFLRDLNGDGIAEGIRGTCRETGKEDTLYMEVSVKDNGYLKNGEIIINGDKNYYLQTAIVKDEIVTKNCVSDNATSISLGKVNNGTQKLLTGVVRSGNYSSYSSKLSALGNNINNYSKVNTITFKGVHVDDNNVETPVNKTVSFNVDWHGTTTASISTNSYYNSDLKKIKDTENNEITITRTITLEEKDNKLLLKTAHIEGTIPSLNGYRPKRVQMTPDTINFSYNANTGVFIAEKNAVLADNIITNGVIGATRKVSFTFSITYSLDALYGRNSLSLEIPIRGYFEGYNNPSSEFANPYKSNVVPAFISAYYYEHQEVGEIVVPRYCWVNISGLNTNNISKDKPLNIYNQVSDQEVADYYKVRWDVRISEKATLKQFDEFFIKKDGTKESTNDITSFVGICFGSTTENYLGSNGWIKVYDDDTNKLLATFYSADWKKYNTSNVYMYDMSVRHIRIETSTPVANQSPTNYSIYNIKEIDDDKITSKYTQDEFMNIKSIQSILVANGHNTGDITDYIETRSSLSFKINNSTITTQESSNIRFDIKSSTGSNIAQWQNGIFLVKIPKKDILELDITKITSKNGIQIYSQEQYEDEENIFIKIMTENEKLAKVDIEIYCKITPDPSATTKTIDVELYAHNEFNRNYEDSADDIYDVNNNLNTSEKVLLRTHGLTYVSSNTLITTQVAKNYNSTGSVAVAPKLAMVLKRQKNATIDIGVTNNYSKIGDFEQTVKNILILGRIPFEGNTYVNSTSDMMSQFDTTMTDKGIVLPDELKGIANVYYSINPNATRDLSNLANGWTTTPENFNDVKTFLIDLGEIELKKGQTYNFSYDIVISDDVEYDEIAYSHHAVYFDLITNEGLYKTQAQPSKLGFKIDREKYKLDFVKYQKGMDKVVPKATYMLEWNDGKGQLTSVTNNSGKISLINLSVGIEYTIKEVKSPTQYELNSDVVKFVADEVNGEFKVDKISGNVREDTIQVIKVSDEEYKIYFEVEDQILPSIKVTKKEQDKDLSLPGVRYRITGKGIASTGKYLITNENGEFGLDGLYVNEEYTLTETRADGYYLHDPIKFVILYDEATNSYSVKATDGNIKADDTTWNDGIPTINFTVEDVKIPRYTLNITKVDKDNHAKVLSGAKFKLIKDKKILGEYVTDENGNIEIPELYQYFADKDVGATYSLSEIEAPQGYAVIKDITFTVENVDGVLQFKEEVPEGGVAKEYTIDNDAKIVNLIIEDSPSFKLVKKDGSLPDEPILPGVKFAIYNIDTDEEPAKDSKGNIIGEKEIINGKEYYTVTTNEKGEITADLVEGLYKAVEVWAEDKYDISDNVYYFGIGASRNVGDMPYFQSELDDVYTYECMDILDDGGVITAGLFDSNSITLNNGQTFVSENYIHSNDTLLVIKYDKDNQVEWARQFKGSDYSRIFRVFAVEDGYIVLGYTEASILDFGNGDVSTGATDTSTSGFIIKFDKNGNVVADDFRGNIIYGTEGPNGKFAVTYGYHTNSITVWNKDVERTGFASFGSDATLVGPMAFDEDENILTVVSGTVTLLDGNTVAGSNLLIKMNKPSTSTARAVTMPDIYEIEWAVPLTNGATVYEDGKIVSNENGDIYVLQDGGVAKVSSDGVLQWEKTVKDWMSDEDNIYTHSMALKSDGKLLMTLYCRASEDSSMDNFIELKNGQCLHMDYIERSGIMMQLSEDGEVEWAKEIEYLPYPNYFEISEEGWIGIPSTGSYKDYLENGEGIVTDSVRKIHKYKLEDVPRVAIKAKETVEKHNGLEVKYMTETGDGERIDVGSFNGIVVLGDGHVLETSAEQAGVIIKYNLNNDVAWTRVLQTVGASEIKSVIETDDKGLVATGWLNGTIDIGDGRTLSSNGEKTGIVIKYSEDGNVEWFSKIGQIVNSVTQTADGKIVVVGNFVNKIELLDGSSLRGSSESAGMIAQYTKDGEFEWAKGLDGTEYEEIHSVICTNDGGILIGAYFGNDVYLDNGLEGFAGTLIKYSADGKMEWTRGLRGTVVYEEEGEKIPNILLARMNDGVLCSADSRLYKFDDNGKLEMLEDLVINSEDNTTHDLFNIKGLSVRDGGLVLARGTYGTNNEEIWKIRLERNIPAVAELTVKNTLKEFNITTSVDGAGGKISGQGQLSYETVTYDGTNVKSIEMVPDLNHEIIKVTVNGKEWPFEVKEDGSYVIPEGTFTNIKEDKHVVVTYALKDNKIVINKVDSETNEPIAGVKFKLDQIEDRPSPEGVIGELTGNSADYDGLELMNEVTGVMGALTNNGTYYFKNEGGKYVPTNKGQSGKVANSYIEIDLTGKTGIYAVKVNAYVSSERWDYGYATITESTKAPVYSSTTGRFMYISDETNSKDYIYRLDGGKKYYLHLGYRKDATGDKGEDQVVINSVNVYGAKEVINKYNFIEENGKYKSSNQGKEDTVSNSYIPIDLTGREGKYSLILNAEISSQSLDYGYVTVTTDETRPEYNSSTGRFVYISGTEAVQDYTTVLDGGQKYYLHLGYRKDSTKDEGEDTFTVSNIRVELSDSDFYHGILETNSEGQALAEINFGKYSLEEITTPKGYFPLDKPAVINFKSDDRSVLENENKVNITVDNGEFVIENIPKERVVVHHYLKDRNGNLTDTQVAPDDLLEQSTDENGNINETYVSKPHLDLGKYELERDSLGDFKIPENASGRYDENTSVIYYYEEKQIPIRVCHYIEGTVTQVPLAEGVSPEDLADEGFRYENDSYKSRGYEGESYKTSAIPTDKLSDKYELVSEPDNPEGNFENDEIVVTYLYRRIARDLIINKTDMEGNALEGVSFKITNKNDPTVDEIVEVTDSEGKIHVTLVSGDYIVEEIETAEGYQIPENPINEITIGTENVELNITNDKIKGKVIVHHYIEGTTDSVTLIDGSDPTEEKTGYIKTQYYTKAREDILGKYECVSIDGVVSGQFIDGTITVIYYYAEIKEPHVEISKSANPNTTPEVQTKVKANDDITYMIKLDNSQGTAGTKIKVKDSVPKGTSFKNGSIRVESVNSDGTIIEGTGVDLSGKTEVDLRDTGIEVEIDAREIKVLSFTVTVVDTDDGKATDLSNNTTITNIAQVSKNPEDTTPTYEDTNEITHVYVEPIITAEKTWKAEQKRTYTNKEGQKIQYVLEGDTIEYTITVTNEGGLGKDIKVVDILQPGMTFVEGSIKVNGRDIAYTLDDLQATGITVNVPAKVGDTNGTATVSFKVTVDELGEDVSGNQIYFGQLKNKATVDGKETKEVVTNVNKSNIIFGKTVNIAGKEANGQEVRIGDELTYNISVSNTGSLPDIVTISDSVPTNTEYVDNSISVKVGDTTYTADDINTGVAGITIVKTGDTVTGILVENMELYPGEDIIVSFKVKVTGEAKDGDTITNIATVNGKETEPVTNPVVRPIIDVQKKIVEVAHITETADDTLKDRKDYVFRGDKITYNIRVTNAGGVEGKVIIKDVISDKVNLDVNSIKVGGTAISGMTAEKFASDGIEVTVPAKTADGNGEVILSFTVTVKGDASVIDKTGVAGDVTNKATWKYEKTIEDPNPSNPENPEIPTEHETEEVKVPVVVIEKKAEIAEKTKESVTAKDEIKYTIVVTNTGTSATGKFVVTDDIPEGTTILNSNGGTISDRTISWTIGSLLAKQEDKTDNIAEISFTVTVDYDAVASKNIVNVAYVNDKPTNETETPYVKPTPKMTTSVTKTGDKIAVLGNQIYYKITYTATIEDFVGKANIVIEDQLPYEIIESKSNLKYVSTDGTVSDEVIEASKNLKRVEVGVGENTIKWEMTEENIDTYKTGKPHEIKLVKEMLLYYDTNTLGESIDNTAIATTQLKEPNPDKPTEDKDVGMPDIVRNTHTVTVKTAYKLPETGRNGTTIFAIIGLSLIGLNVVMFIFKKKKAEDNL